MGKVQVEADIPQVVNYQTCTVDVGSTTTLNSGSNATVNNSGTVYNAILDFGIPRGKSAYEQALEGGYVGTEEEFNRMLAESVGGLAQHIEEFLRSLQLFKNGDVKTYVVGTSTETYDGSSTVFPVENEFAVPISVYVNGQYKEINREYTEDKESNTITFNYSLLSGDRVNIVANVAVIDVEALDGVVANKVSKTGDSMTGNLNILATSSGGNKIVLGTSADQAGSDVATPFIEGKAGSTLSATLGRAGFVQKDSDSSEFVVQAIDPSNNNNLGDVLRAGCAGGSKFAACVTPPNDANNTMIANTAWVRQHTITDAGGTINGILTVDKAEEHFIAKDTVIDRNVPAQENTYGGWYTINDKNDKLFGRIYAMQDSDGNNRTCMQVWSNETTNIATTIGVVTNADGTIRGGFCPTPVDNATGNIIATAEWVRKLAIGFPNYSAGVSKSANTGYTAATNGWVFLSTQEVGNSACDFWVDQVNVLTWHQAQTTYNDGSCDTIVIPIKSGSAYQFNISGGVTVHKYIWFPCI